MNYLQLFYCDTDPNGVWLDYYMYPRKDSDASYQCLCHFLDTVYCKLSDCMELFKSIHDFIKWYIDHSFYINISIDEYYVNKRSAYQKRHYQHYNLLYGYDDEACVYSVIGYDNKNRIESSDISYDALNLEMIMSDNIVLYKHNANKVGISFNIDYVIASIKELIQGINSNIKTANLLKQQDGVYGLNIFNELLTSPRGNELLITDERISFLLYEHSKIMQDRLEYLLANNYIKQSFRNELIELSICIQHMAEILMNLVLKHKVINKMEMKIRVQFEALYRSEKNFYNRLLEVLLLCKDNLSE